MIMSAPNYHSSTISAWVGNGDENGDRQETQEALG